jgi:hypothetical protein
MNLMCAHLKVATTVTVLLSMMSSIVPTSGSGDNDLSFLVIADMHTMSEFVYNSSDIHLFNTLTAILQNIQDNYIETDIVLAPGDVVSFGGTTNEKLISLTGIPDENEAVYNAAVTSYTKTIELYQEAGFITYMPCVGDHEIGGNEGFVFSGWRSKLTSISSYRQGWIDIFMKNENGAFKFNEGVSNVPSRPSENSGFQGTSYAYRRKNSLFISVDIFKVMNDGTSDYYDRQNGYGGEGAITCTLEGLHATWFESVLKTARDDSSIKHIFVEAHVPIFLPVRKVRCSGQFLDDETDSTFWRLMEEYKVDVYFAGEVHAVTVSKSKVQGSNLLQIVSRGNGLTSFLTVETTDDTIVFKQYREIGSNQKFNNDYVQSGLLTLDKSNPSDPQISSSGELKILDDEVALMHFDFEIMHKIDTRPIHGLSNDDSLVAKYQVMGDTNCTESIHNMGSFGEQYDAQVANIELVPGRKANTLAGKFVSNSRFGIFSIGPYTAGMAHSSALWMRTPETSKTMMLLYFGPAWKSSAKDSLHLTLKHGEINLQFSEGGSAGKFELVEKKMLADDQWHHIVVVMPFNSCRYSQAQLYIDGILCKTQQTHGSDNHLFFHTAGRLSIGSYGYRKFSNDDGSLDTFEGEVDDVMVWSKTLQKQDVVKLWDNGRSSRDVSKVIFCGRGGGCAEGDRDIARIDEIHEVRCCRECSNCSSPWEQKCPSYDPELFALSKMDGVCKRGSFMDALDFCRNITNGRLCTPLEVQNSCAKGTGCQFDREMIWTCAYDGHLCTEDTECCGSCVNGECDGERKFQEVQSLNNGHDAPLLTDRPPLSTSCAHLNLSWIVNPMSSLSLIVWAYNYMMGVIS